MVEERAGERPLEEEGLARIIGNLQASCSQVPASPPVSSKYAAVLVPLFEDARGEVHVVLTQRSSRLNKHSGEVCFPGGKRDGAEDDVATALREANEELGLNPRDVTLLGCLPPFLSKHLLSVLGLIPAGLRFTPNQAEVEHVFTAPLRMFLEAGPGYRSHDVEWAPGIPYRVHYWDYSSGGKQFLIWGLTAGMLVVVAEKAFGRPPAFAASPLGAPEYTSLAYDGTALVFRGGRPAAPEAQQLASAAAGAGEHGARSAAEAGALVTQVEAEAAVGGDGGSSGEDGQRDGGQRHEPAG
eukprot:scaffold5.g651.t1